MKTRLDESAEPWTVFETLEPPTADELTEDYLDRLAARMVGRIPARERLRLKDEACFHLERLVAQYQVEGQDARSATEKAIHRYGPPAQIADEFIEAWFEAQGEPRLYRRFGRANFTAFVFLGAAQLLYVVLLQVRVFLPNGAAYALPLSPGAARQLLPDPLPLPQSVLELLSLYGYPIVAPIVAGWFVGVAVPVRAERAVTNALMPIVLYSFVMGVLTLPQTAGVLFALFQLAYWLPVGALAAWLANYVAAGRRARREELA